MRALLLGIIFALICTTLVAQDKPKKSAKPAKAVPAAKQDAAEKKSGPIDLAHPTEAVTTEIYADEAFFDSAKNVGKFTGHVKVNDPRFAMQSDKLTAYISKENKGLEKAVADSHVAVVRDRPDPNGGPPQRTLGLSDNAIYTTGDGIGPINRKSTRAAGRKHAYRHQSRYCHDIESGGTIDHARSEPHRNPAGTIAVAWRVGVSVGRHRPAHRHLHPITVAISETMTSGTLPATSPDLSKESGIGTEEVLITEQLVKIYGGRAVVNGVNLNVRAGEIVGLLGPNGAGKTTSFYMIVGLVRPNSGRVLFLRRGRDELSDVQAGPAGHGISAAGGIDFPQDDGRAKHPRHSRDAAALQSRNGGIVAMSCCISSASNASRKTSALTLSGGEKRRLTIARSLVTNPQSAHARRAVQRRGPDRGLRRPADHGQSAQVRARHMITDHNVRETLSIVDRAYLIFEGRVESEGTKDFLINDPISRQLYLGERFRM